MRTPDPSHRFPLVTSGWACTINVGGGPGGSTARTAAMRAWAAEARKERQPVLVFAQETTPEWLADWEPDYQVILGVSNRWRIKSALLCHDSLTFERLDERDFPTLGYHGDYLAAARWCNAPGGPVVCVSVHASPNPADLRAYHWPEAKVAPRVVPDDKRYHSGLYDSDLVLRTLELMTQDNRVLAAGDLNESRRDDHRPGGAGVDGWGHRYFERAGLHFVQPLRRSWPDELPTRGELQLDHVLVSKTAAELVPSVPEPFLDPAWTGGEKHLSDHRAVWFPVAL